jgi:hypothetical protein
MADVGIAVQVLRFQEVGDTQVALPQLVDALRDVPGFRQALFLEHTEDNGVMGVLLWDGERALVDGFSNLRQKLGVAPPHAEVQQYRVVGLEPDPLPAARFARTTTRQFPAAAHHEAWRHNVSDRIVPALRTLDGFAGVVWAERRDGRAGFALELWSALRPEGETHNAVANQPVAETLNASLLDVPVLRERFRVTATASAAVRA